MAGGKEFLFRVVPSENDTHSLPILLKGLVECGIVIGLGEFVQLHT